MLAPDGAVFLLDVVDTLLDNDRFAADLGIDQIGALIGFDLSRFTEHA